MNISITDHLASYVRKKVKSGRFNNASEVIREAIRRMEDEELRALRLAKPTVEDILADFTAEQLDGIRQRVLNSIRQIDAGEFVEYDGQKGLEKLAAEVRARGRKRLRSKTSGK